jgi:hypothetical protein
MAGESDSIEGGSGVEVGCCSSPGTVGEEGAEEVMAGASLGVGPRGTQGAIMAAGACLGPLRAEATPIEEGGWCPNDIGLVLVGADLVPVVNETESHVSTVFNVFRHGLELSHFDLVKPLLKVQFF